MSPITTVLEHPPTGRRPTSVTLVSGLAAASCRLGHDDMGIVAGVQTLFGNVGRRPVGSTGKGKLLVVGGGVISVLGNVVADIILALVEVQAVNPLPNITPKALDTTPYHINLAVRASGSTSQVGHAVARASLNSGAVAVTIATPDLGLHIIVGELHQHKHLDSRQSGNVDQTPTSSLVLGVATHSSSGLADLRGSAGHRLVIGRSLVSAHIDVIAFLAAVFESRVQGKAGSGLICDLDVLDIALTVTLEPELRDFDHHITGRQGFTLDLRPRVASVEAACSCGSTNRSGGAHANSVITSRPCGRGSGDIAADTVDFHEGKLHALRLTVRGDRYLNGSKLTAALGFDFPSTNLMHHKAVSAGSIGSRVDGAAVSASQDCAHRVGYSNGGREIVVGGGVVGSSTGDRYLGRGVFRLGIAVYRTVLHMVAVTNGNHERRFSLSGSQSSGLRSTRFGFINTSDDYTGERRSVINGDRDIDGFTVCRSRTRMVDLIGGKVEHTLSGIRESGEVIGLTLYQSLYHESVRGVLAKVAVVHNQFTFGGVGGIAGGTHANHDTGNGADQITVCVAVFGFQKVQPDTGLIDRESVKRSHVVRSLTNFLQNLVNRPFCFCPTHYLTPSSMVMPSALNVIVLVFIRTSFS